MRLALLVSLGAAAQWGCRSSPPDAGGEGAGAGGVSDSIQSYTAFAASLDEANPQVEQLVEGLRLLAGAVGSATDGTASALVDLRIAAEHVELSPDDPATTANVRSSLMAAANALPAATAFQSAAESIDPSRTVADERQAIAAALGRAGEALASR